MTDQTTPAIVGSDAQPIADVNPIDTIINDAETNEIQTEVTEPKAPETEADEAWPKKAENALAKAKGKAAQLRAERDQERQARQRLEQELAQYNSPQKKTDTAGEPNEKDFTNYAEYMRAVQKYDLAKEIAKLEGKQQQTQQSQQEQAWTSERENYVATKAQELVKDNPEILATIEEYADVADEFPPAIQRLFLEADNAPLAFYNLAKEGKLESLATMSPARAAMEIGRAQTQAPTKPRTKAPTPLPASRGSVPSGKSLDSMSGDELLKWVES